MKNAEEICLESPSPRARSARRSSSSCRDTTEVVVRRDYILDLMKTRSTLTGEKHTAAEYDAAKAEPSS